MVSMTSLSKVVENPSLRVKRSGFRELIEPGLLI